MTIGIYTRITKTDDRLGVTRQYDETYALIEREIAPGEEVRVYEDNDTSASKSNVVRKDYRRMLADIKSGELRLVGAWHTDRMYRRLEELPELVDAVNERDVKIKTCKSGEIDLATSSGRLVARMLGAAAEYEIERMRERAASNSKQRAESGAWNGGRRPTGYDLAHDETGKRVLVINEREANAIRYAVSAVLAGTSQIVVARAFSAAIGKHVKQSTLRQTIEKPMLAGLAIYRGEIIGRGDWPAIISEDEHYALKALVTRRELGKRVSKGRVHLGSRLYRCSICKGTATTSGHARGAMRYRCEVGCCARIGSYIDDYVERTMQIIVSSARVRAELADTSDVDLSPLFDERAQLISTQANLVAAVSAGIITMQALTEGSINARQRVEEIDALIAAGSSSGDHASVLLAHDPAAAFADADIDVKRGLIDRLLDVELLPASKGRPAGWKVGEPYFDTRSVKLTDKLTGVELSTLVTAQE